MQIAVQAKCWDGERRKSLNEIKVEGFPVLVEIPADKNRWKFDPKLKAILGFALPIALIAGGLPPIGLVHAVSNLFAPTPLVGLGDAVPAMAAAGGGMHTKIIHAFDPLVHLIQDLAHPIAAVMIAGGCLYIMTGNREKGMQMMQNAAIGYILVQMAPMMLNLLVGIGAGV